MGTLPLAGETETTTAELTKPKVAQIYQKSLDRAWQEALKGNSPVNTCAALKGRAHGAYRGDDAEAKARAVHAVDACSVTVSARYLFIFLDQIEAGEKTCMDLLTKASPKISAMVMGVGGEGPEVTKDRRKRLLDTIAPRVEELCPDLAPVFLRNR